MVQPLPHFYLWSNVMKTYLITAAICAVCLFTAVPTTAQQGASSTASTSAIEKVRSLPAKEQPTEGSTGYAIAADELQSIAPEFVQKRTEILPSPHARQPQMTQQRTVHSVDYAAMVPLLVKAMQEQQAEIDRLRSEMSALKAQARK